MNKVCLIGRLTSNAELRYTGSNIAFTRLTLAVNRNFKNQNGEYETDFISCIAYRKTAELICNSCQKGSLLAVEGRIQTGRYELQDGTTKYTTDIVVDTITFLESKREKDDKLEPGNTGQTQSPYKFEQTQMTVDPFADFGDTVSIDDNFLD